MQYANTLSARQTPMGAVSLFAVALLIIGSRVLAADAQAGRQYFRGQCLSCHSAEAGDGGGAQGPSLIGVFGRPAAAEQGFSYTPALRAAHLQWDAGNLERFLRQPGKLVPGTAMAVAVTDSTALTNLIAYLQAHQGEHPQQAQPGSQDIAQMASDGAQDWRQDAPGRVHRIDLGNLPAPFHTASARNNPKMIARPADAKLALPPGFAVNAFAADLEGPRRLLTEANGDILVTEMEGGRVSVLHPSADGSHAAGRDVFAGDLSQPYGLALYPDSSHPEWLYVSETNRVLRYRFHTGEVHAQGAPEVVIDSLPGGGHHTRDLAFSADGKQLFVAVGSGSNVAESMSTRSAAEAQRWDAQHGTGAAWDAELNRADVLVFDAVRPGQPKVFAAGIRNCVSLTVQPANGALWCTTNERDGLGDDLVPDYSTRVREGGFYGWPWYYMGAHEDPRLRGQRPDLRTKVLVPDVPYQAHSAALNLTFYTATGGTAAFPAEYEGDGFAMFHGSWNRAFRTGHKIVRVRMRSGVPTGEYEDFMTGFIVDNGDAWGRPVAATVARDGALLVSDDGGNLIHRIAWTGPPKKP
jgi:glucose/arabinose dehydrogenase/cytochrome c2